MHRVCDSAPAGRCKVLVLMGKEARALMKLPSEEEGSYGIMNRSSLFRHMRTTLTLVLTAEGINGR